MGGRGPAPKANKVRRNKDSQPLHVIEVEPTEQPALEDIVGEVNPATGEPFTDATLRFWGELADFATLGLLMEAQWSLLARAMILDDAVMRGHLGSASEARLQLQKFGIAPDDVLRMRVQVVQAEEAESKREVVRGSQGSRWGDLRAVET